MTAQQCCRIPRHTRLIKAIALLFIYHTHLGINIQDLARDINRMPAMTVEGLARSQTKTDLLKHLNLSPETYSLMSVSSYFTYR